MQFASLIALALAVSSGALAAPAGAVSNILHAPAVIPAIYRQAGLANKASPLQFTMHLKGAKMDQLEAKMLEIASTGGNWLTEAELAEYATPAASDLAAVESFLKSAGIPASALSYSPMKDELTVQSTVGQAATLFAAQLLNFDVRGSQVAKAKSLTIPASIASVVQHVSPLTNFADIKTGPAKSEPLAVADAPEFKRELDTRDVATSCNTSAVTPACLRDLYQTTGYTPVGAANQVDVTVMGYIGQYVSQSDLTTFLQRYRPDAANYQLPIKNTAGGANDQSNPGVEAMLDVETVIAQNYPLNTEFTYYGNSNGDIFSNTFSYLINNRDNTTRPGVVSISYGATEDSFSSSQASTMCSNAQKLTALGTTAVLASGDNGIDGVQASNAPSCRTFHPTYPSGCPYVLSVGGTQNFSPEVAVDPSLAGFWSGSGFSTLFSTPSYQTSFVQNYEAAIGSLNNGKYNKNGRGFPDIAAQASKYVIRYASRYAAVSGTSAAAPTMAAILSLINDALRQQGKGRLGWVQPKLYGANGAGLTDITSGQAKGCPSPDQNLAFPVKSSWDPVTGLGTPIFPSLRSVFGA